MSSIQNIRAAKYRFNEHCENHRCRIGECDLRKQLWLDYMRSAEHWGGYKLPPAELLRGLL